MQDMELSGDIRWKKARAVSALLACALIMTGCSAGVFRRAVSNVRPEVNNQGDMLLDPVVATEYSGYLLEDDGSKGNPEQNIGLDNVGGNSAYHSASGTATGTIMFNPDYYAELPYKAMAAPGYTKYLDEQIYEPIMQILKDLPDEKLDRLYFRICHYGYEPQGDSLIYIQQSAAFNRRLIGSVNNVGGESLSEFALNWLLTLDVVNAGKTNRQILGNIRATTVNRIVNSGVSLNSSWQSANSDTRLSQAVRTMWGAQSDDVRAKLSMYTNLIYSKVVGVVPNVVLRMRSNEELTTTVTINPNISSTLPYQCRMNLTDIDRLFCLFNQYPNRDSANVFKYNSSDDGSMVFSYIDGYTKTIVLLGVSAGDSLSDVLGDNLAKVESIIGGTLNYTELTKLAEFCKEYDVLSSRARGVN